MFSSTPVSYRDTGAFSTIVTDYLQGNESLRPFYGFPPTVDGLLKAVAAKRGAPVDRALLVKVLEAQYAGHEKGSRVHEQIAALAMENTFTITTAHQPNLFTGPLYFIYKILHAIRMADEMNRHQANLHFVPVYYMGSEDADFGELNHTWVQGRKLEWQRAAGGAVGRMQVDTALLKLLDELEGQLAVEPFGKEIMDLLRSSYAKGRTMGEATFHFVDALFGKWGLLVLQPDHADLKRTMIPVFEDDLFHNTPSDIVSATSQKLGERYNVQAHPREVNLFYLDGAIRERIIRTEGGFTVNNTAIQFSDDEMREALTAFPERFSPNVILRGLFQERILPNVAFIGGGGELAYWLQLKELFDHYKTPFPLLVLRNSFLIVESRWGARAARLGFSIPELFRPVHGLMNALVQRHNGALSLDGSLAAAAALFEDIAEKAGRVDPGLSRHTAALKTKALTQLQELEKKMLRAERRKYGDQQRQLTALKDALFPRNGLQERVENMSYYYARWGTAFLEALLQHGTAWEQQFIILAEG